MATEDLHISDLDTVKKEKNPEVTERMGRKEIVCYTYDSVSPLFSQIGRAHV